MENNMIIVKGFKMSGKFGEVTLDELTLPCTKEAWDILGNLADVASDAAEECLDTSECRVPTESGTVKTTSTITNNDINVNIKEEINETETGILPVDELKTVYEQLPGQQQSFNSKKIDFDIGNDEEIRMIFKYKSSSHDQSLSVSLISSTMHSNFVIENEPVNPEYCYTSTMVDKSFKQFIDDILDIPNAVDKEYNKTKDDIINLVNRYEKYIKVYS